MIFVFLVAKHVLNNYFRGVHSFGKAVEGHRIGFAAEYLATLRRLALNLSK